MGFKLERVHIWTGEIADKVGGMATKLAPLAQAGANLQYISTRRQPDRPGTGILYVAPVTGPAQVRAARQAGRRRVLAHQPGRGFRPWMGSARRGAGERGRLRRPPHLRGSAARSGAG